MLHESGFSLIETLLAVFISSVLLLGVVRLMTAVSRNEQHINQSLMLQEKKQFLQQYFGNEISVAGYIGCASKVLRGSCIKQPFTITGAGSSQRIIVEKMQAPILSLKYAVFNGNKIVLQGVSSRIKKNKALLIADCRHCDLVTINKISRSQAKKQMILTLNKKVNFPEVSSTTVAMDQTIEWYVKKSSGVYRLYEKQGSRGEALLDNVNGLKAKLLSPQSLQLSLTLLDPATKREQELPLMIALKELSYE